MDDPQSCEETLLRAIRGLNATERVKLRNELVSAEGALLRRIQERLAAEEKEYGTTMPEGPQPDRIVQEVEGPGSIVGRYRLLEKIGEGGFGVVYVAEQKEPVKRRVALKVIKLGMDTRQVVARFESERQALALMDHPNIAKVLDGGATESGRPYFVMELVKGVPITEHCDLNHLSTDSRLKLFIQVCQAIQHAHQKGIIHRDIKPSNTWSVSMKASRCLK